MLVRETNPPSGGIYTSVGTYDHSEIVAYVIRLSKHSGHSVDTLLRLFGEYLFDSFVRTKQHLFNQATDMFSFLESIETYIHVEVLKLYPDAELPRFESNRIHSNRLEMMYYSNRSMWALAEGLMTGCSNYFKEPIQIVTEAIKNDGSQVKFIITKVNE